MEYMKTIFCYAPSSGLSMDIRGGNSVDLGVIILRQSIGIIIQIPGMNIALKACCVLVQDINLIFEDPV